MADKKLLTRIIMNHGEWASYAGKVAKDGEVIYVKVGATQANGKVSEPIWMQKIGDGVTEVQNLPWVVAPAADVYEWAKKASLDAKDLPEIPGSKLGITVTVTGNGNAITEASWNESAKTLTLTKGETFATKKEFDEHKHTVADITDYETDFASKIQPINQEIAKKADKVTGATEGNFAGLDANGNLTDSGKKATDFAEAGHNHDDAYSKLGHTHEITATGDDAISVTGGELSVTIEHNTTLSKAYETVTTATEQKPTFGGAATVVIPQLKVNEYGHVTEAKDQTVEIYIPGLNEVAESSHTHADGKGTKVTGDGAKAIDLNVEFKADLVAKNDKKYLQLVDVTSKEVITEFDTTEFIKDGMIDTVEISEDGLSLVITWNADSDKGDKTVTTIPLTGLVDVYTGDATDTITVAVSDTNVITAEVNPTSIKDGHIAADAAIARTKLSSDVQESLGKADTALQSHQDISGKADKVEGATADNFAGLDESGNLIDSGFNGDSFYKKDDEEITIGSQHTTSLSENGLFLNNSDAGNNASFGLTGLSISESENATDREYFEVGFETSGDTATGKCDGVVVEGSAGFKTAFNEFLGTSRLDDIIDEDGNSHVDRAIEADRLDGHDADYFATADHNHDDEYAPIDINTGVMSVTANDTEAKPSGIKVTGDGKDVKLEIDDTIVFILDGGNASNLD